MLREWSGRCNRYAVGVEFLRTRIRKISDKAKSRAIQSSHCLICSTEPNSLCLRSGWRLSKWDCIRMSSSSLINLISLSKGGRLTEKVRVLLGFKDDAESEAGSFLIW